MSRSPSPQQSPVKEKYLDAFNQPESNPSAETDPEKELQIKHLESTLMALSAKLKLSQSIESERNNL